ncbi:MAG: hypothetical protein IPG25_13290 [Proteobacteria bacterium]|nr:hypothetical protein [Pseudomonadota bacterium]
MGFGATPVIVSVLIEALILGALGGLLGGLLAYLLLNGMRSSTLNFQSFSQITYAFTVTPRLMVTGIVYGLILTFIAGLLPSIRAARTPITSGLREL